MVPVAPHSIEAADPVPKFTVIVFNYAEAPADVLAEAQGFAQKVFQHAGVGIEWIEPSSVATQRESDTSRNGLRLVMRIVPNSMIVPGANQNDLLGFSLVSTDGGVGFTAGAYYERVQQFSVQLGGDTALVLGYVIAHELGHLLLGANSHLRSGIMSYPFEHRELLLAAQNRLHFTPPQAKRIRERLQEHVQNPKRAGVGGQPPDRGL